MLNLTVNELRSIVKRRNVGGYKSMLKKHSKDLKHGALPRPIHLPKIKIGPYRHYCKNGKQFK